MKLLYELKKLYWQYLHCTDLITIFQLEHLVFCLFVNSQYETVMKEMLRCFPRGTGVLRPKKKVLFPISASFWKRSEKLVFLFYFFRLTVSFFEEVQVIILPTWLLFSSSQSNTFGGKKTVITLLLFNEIFTQMFVFLCSFMIWQ